MDKKVNIKNLSRRQFLKTTALGSAGLVLGFSLPLPEKAHARMLDSSDLSDYPVSSWLQINSLGEVILTIPVSEMGQGSQTALAMILADEIGADIDELQVQSADNSILFNNPMMGMQLTGGSTAVRAWWQPLRIVGATLRTMLIEVAAKQWGISITECYAKKGYVLQLKGDKKVHFSTLVDSARDVLVTSNPVLKLIEEFDYIGRPLARLDTLAKVTGEAIFGIDVVVPNMLIATVAQSPVFGGKLDTMNRDKALAMSGVKAVIPIDNGVAVVADSYWQAKQAMMQLKPTFKGGVTQGLNTEKIESILASGLSEQGEVVLSRGRLQSPESSWVTETYHVPYLAHSTMEPMNATAWVRDDHCEIWAPTQAQSIGVKKAAEITLLELNQITLHTTFLGGGFGRRSAVDYIEQAVTLSMALEVPVKVIWSREQDIQHDFYRPAASCEFNIQVDSKGYPLHWQHKIVSDSILDSFLDDYGQEIDSQMSEGAKELVYHLPNMQVNAVRKKLGIPVGFWRSVGYSFNTFFVESMLDELAHKANIDPSDYRRKLLKNATRSLAVLDKVLQLSGWVQSFNKSKGKGIAFAKSFGSYVAEVVELESLDKGGFRIKRIYCVIDCGIVINPLIVQRQIQSAVIYGLTAALKGKIHLENGQVVETNFNDYPALTMQETPEIKVEIIRSQEAPGGYGEPGLPPLAPALTNAIFSLTAERIRRLPIRKDIFIS